MTPAEEKALKSEGGRLERKATRAYLQRKIKRGLTIDQMASITEVFNWVLSRQARYDKKPGGL